MAGTTEGGRLAAKKNKEIYGADFYHRIGSLGGAVKGHDLQKPKGFAANRELAAIAGRIGGLKSRRGKRR